MITKTKLLVPLFLILVSLGGYYFLFKKQTEQPQLALFKQKNNPGQEQVLSNNTSKNKNMSLEKTGIYEISTTAMKDTSAASADSMIPPMGKTFTGVYLTNDDSIEIPANTTVQFTPVPFKLLGSKEAFTLTKIGTYYVGSQIASGKYQVTFTALQKEQQIQLIQSDNQKNEQLSELNDEQQTLDIDLKKGSLLLLKSNSFDVKVSFERTN